MTKERFVKIHEAKGYTAEEKGKMLFLFYKDWSAIWFIDDNGMIDMSKAPFWSIQ